MADPVIRSSNLDFFLARAAQARAEGEAATLAHMVERRLLRIRSRLRCALAEEFELGVQGYSASGSFAASDWPP